jgi:DNA invertase Pin-like site-specific DNA recombinase
MLIEYAGEVLANARAKGKHIGRVRKRNSVLIESLLEVGLSYREIARIATCSHGSVHAQKLEYKKRKALEKIKQDEQLEQLQNDKVGRFHRSAPGNFAGVHHRSVSDVMFS